MRLFAFVLPEISREGQAIDKPAFFPKILYKARAASNRKHDAAFMMASPSCSMLSASKLIGASRSKLMLVAVADALECSRLAALPGREQAEHNGILAELRRLLEFEPRDHRPQRLRLVVVGGALNAPSTNSGRPGRVTALKAMLADLRLLDISRKRLGINRKCR